MSQKTRGKTGLKSYHSPNLVAYGRVRDITGGGGSVTKDNQGQGQSKS